MIYLFLFILALILARVQYMISKFNLNAPWSGYGAIQGVLDKSSDAPMVYRVLVPWLIGRNIKLWKYQVYMILLIWAALVSMYFAWGIQNLLISIILIAVSMWYDYWDWTGELIGFALTFVSFQAAMVGVIIHGLSRETAPLVGLVYALHSHDYYGGAIITLMGLLTLLLVRKVQGKHKLYCKRWMIRENIELLKKGSVAAWLSILLIAMYMPTILLRQESIGLLPLVIAGLTMAKINETRVFVSVIPYVALWLSQWL